MASRELATHHTHSQHGRAANMQFSFFSGIPPRSWRFAPKRAQTAHQLAIVKIRHFVMLLGIRHLQSEERTTNTCHRDIPGPVRRHGLVPAEGCGPTTGLPRLPGAAQLRGVGQNEMALCQNRRDSQSGGIPATCKPTNEGGTSKSGLHKLLVSVAP